MKFVQKGKRIMYSERSGGSSTQREGRRTNAHEIGRANFVFVAAPGRGRNSVVCRGGHVPSKEGAAHEVGTANFVLCCSWDGGPEGHRSMKFMTFVKGQTRLEYA